MRQMMLAVAVAATTMAGCDRVATGRCDVSFVEINPGHFHAALVLNRSYPGVDKDVHVYAPKGPELDAHLALVKAFNTREKNPTAWNEIVYTGDDFLEKAMKDRAGNVVMLAGRNDLKPDYYLAAAENGFHVLSDKPMGITPAAFAKLEKAFAAAKKNGTLFDDVMTERHEITTILQRELSREAAIYGEQEKGTPDDPAVTKESVHHFYKLVNGKPLTRPGWYYDTDKEGEGITDVTSHLVDLVQWEVFPEVELQRSDVKMISAKVWPTAISAADYKLSTGLDTWPAFLKKDVDVKNVLQCRANGAFTYQLKGVNAKISVLWNFMPPQGGGDTHYSLMRGTKSEIVIRQGKEQGFRPALYVVLRKGQDAAAVGAALKTTVAKLAVKYPGLDVKETKPGAEWQVVVPKRYDIGHEAHFSQEVEEFIGWLRKGNQPAWEPKNMLVKYWTILQAYEMSRATK